MKAVVIFGSPHKQGNTARMTDEFLSSLLKDVEREIFYTYDMDVSPCIGCGLCEREDACAFNDDMTRLGESLLDSDIVVFATPVYYCSFPAPMKAVIDRMQRYFSAQRTGRSSFANKERHGVLIASAGAPSERGEVLLRQLRWVLPTINAELAHCIVAADMDRIPLGEDILSRCRQAAIDTAIICNKKDFI